MMTVCGGEACSRPRQHEALLLRDLPDALLLCASAPAILFSATAANAKSGSVMTRANRNR